MFGKGFRGITLYSIPKQYFRSFISKCPQISVEMKRDLTYKIAAHNKYCTKRNKRHKKLL